MITFRSIFRTDVIDGLQIEHKISHNERVISGNASKFSTIKDCFPFRMKLI